MEEVREVTLRAVVDTNKATHRIKADDVADFVEQWNDLADDHGLQKLSLAEDGDDDE